MQSTLSITRQWKNQHESTKVDFFYVLTFYLCTQTRKKAFSGLNKKMTTTHISSTISICSSQINKLYFLCEKLFLPQHYLSLIIVASSSLSIFPSFLPSCLQPVVQLSTSNIAKFIYQSVNN